MATTLTQSVRTIRTSNPGYYTYRCIVTENSYSVANNTSNVTVTFSIAGPWAPSFSEWNTSYGIIIDGTVQSTGSSSPDISTSYVQLLSWTGDIAHNSDGAKSINVSVYLNNGSAGYLPTQYTSSSPLSMGSVVLTTIPRASSYSLSASSVAIGTNITVNISRASSSFTHYVKVYYSWANYYVEKSGVGTSVTFTIPTSWYGASAGKSSLTAYCRVDTYNGSTFVGRALDQSFTVTIPSTIGPSIGSFTLDPVDVNGSNVLIQGKNKLSITASGCSGGYGSSLLYKITGSDISTQNSSSITVGPFISSGTKKYTLIVTDAGGRTATKSASITCHAYASPYFSAFSAHRCNSDGTANENGTCVKCSYTLAFSSVNNSNDVTVKILYKKNSATSWSTTTALTDSKTTSGSTILSNIEPSSSYSVYATIADNYGGSGTSGTVTIFGESRILNITADGTGVAFGKMAESSKLFESKYKMKSPGITSSRGARPTDANIGPTDEYTGCLEYYLASGDMTSNKPNPPACIDSNGVMDTSGDGHILHLHWDKTNGFDTQLYLQNRSGTLMTRGCDNGTWGNWRVSIDSENYHDYLPYYVYELGFFSDDSWRWRKWNDGSVEAWYRKELGQIELTTAKANGVWSNDTYQAVDIEIPSGLFTQAPIATGNVCSNGYTCLQVSNTTATTVSYRIWAPYSSSPSGCVVSIQLMGS